MDFVYKVLWIPQTLWIVLSETIHILRGEIFFFFFFGGGLPKIFTIGFVYKAPSSGRSLLTHNLPSKSDSKEVWDCCLMPSENAALFKDWWTLIHQYYVSRVLLTIAVMMGW